MILLIVAASSLFQESDPRYRRLTVISALGAVLYAKYSIFGVIFLGLIEWSMALLTFFLVLFLRFDYSTFGNTAFFLLFLAGFWGFAGPVLIFFYECSALPAFVKAYSKYRGKVAQPDELRSYFKSNIFEDHLCRIISYAWIFSCLLAFLLSSDTLLLGFGIKAFLDPLWYLIFANTLLYGFYTSIGFCLSWRTLKIVALVIRDLRPIDVTTRDMRYLSQTISQLSRLTAVPLMSGMLFVPLLSSSILFYDYDRFYASSALSILLSISIFIIAYLPSHRLAEAIASAKRQRRLRLFSEFKAAPNEADTKETILLRDILTCHRLALADQVKTHNNVWQFASDLFILLLIPLLLNISSSYLIRTLDGN